MSASISAQLLASGSGWGDIFNCKIVHGNGVWRFALVLLIVVIALVVGRVVQYSINAYAARIEKKKGVTALTLLVKALANPVYVLIFAAGIFFCKAPLYFHDEHGIRTAIQTGWTTMARVVAAIAVAYGLYRLVEVIEYYLGRLVGKTETRLDDMLVPVARKALRITIAIIAALLIAENILGADRIKSLLFSAGIGGIAVALAAKDTIANFFASITIFTDRPFHMNDLVKIDGHLGPVEEVGFRSTRVRTLEGHLITVPNSVIANSIVENVGRRPYIRRTSNITITYDAGHTKAKRAVEIIKEILAQVPEVNADPECPPRVYFNEFNDWSLNIYMSYWVKPPDYWLYHQVNERVNLEMMKRFEAEQIEFAFPSQTLYVKKD
ncbi:MAG: mechanosensitive ion channel family protein [Planctomycetota bacterium]|jgi:MscS family membrane protein